MESTLPFSPGEKLTFELKWFEIKAGEATLMVLPVEKRGGKEVFHFVMEAKTTPFLDRIYRVRDRIDSYADKGMNHSIYYKKRQREGSYRKDVVVEFDWEKKEALYETIGKPGKKAIPVQAGTFDPLGIFYYIRTLDLKGKKALEHPVSDGSKLAMGRATIVREEIIEIGRKKYRTYLLEPDLKDIGGVFKKSKDASIQIWLTADEKKIPVRIKSKVAVGNFVGEIVSIEGIK